MRGSVAATFVVLFAGLAAAGFSFGVWQANLRAKGLAGFDEVRANMARLEGENIRLRAENTTLKELATGRMDIREMLDELRGLFWAAFGPYRERERSTTSPPGDEQRGQSSQRQPDPADG